MTPLQVAVRGIGAWLPGAGNWPDLRDALRDPAFVAPTDAVRRPSPALLPPAERRRVPDGVAVALEAAREALAMAGPLDAGTLATVFASAHGDLAIVDYLCATLASDPTLVSPTRFHHSVHNAASGYWTIATPCSGPSTALAAGDETFALGLLDAVTMVVAESRPVLLVAFDTPAVGLLARVAPNTALFGAALLLGPVDETPGSPRLTLTIHAGASQPPLPVHGAFRTAATSSPAARALAVLERFAVGAAATVNYPLHAASTLAVHVDPAPRGDGSTLPVIE